MANTFKNAALANVSPIVLIRHYILPLQHTQTVILGLAIANKTTSAVTVQVQFRDSSASADFQLLDGVTIPANTTLETLAGQKYILRGRRHSKSKSRNWFGTRCRSWFHGKSIRGVIYAVSWKYTKC